MWGSRLGNAITDVAGIRVGHSTNLEAATGCTVILCPQGAVAGVDVRGSAPGTRETDLLRPGTLVQEIHGLLLSGGSAFGLDAASGVMRYLEERGFGFKIGAGVVPIVPAAIIFDLGLVTHEVRPGAEDGYAACLNATDGPPEEGSVGAGTGATVGKMMGRDLATKGGIGTSSVRLGHIVVGAMAVVNALGDVVDPDTCRVLAGPQGPGEPRLLPDRGCHRQSGPRATGRGRSHQHHPGRDCHQRLSEQGAGHQAGPGGPRRPSLGRAAMPHDVGRGTWYLPLQPAAARSRWT